MALLERKTGALDQAAPLTGWALPDEFLRLRRLLETRLGNAGTRAYVQVWRLSRTFGWPTSAALSRTPCDWAQGRPFARTPRLGEGVAHSLEVCLGEMTIYRVQRGDLTRRFIEGSSAPPGG